ncbi:MAG: hypothetical protein WCR72_00530 [Bacteroidota bacterium]
MLKAVWFFILPVLVSVSLFSSCAKEETIKQASLILKTGVAYTADGASIPVGGSIRIGVMASGAGVPLTYIRIDRITGNDTLTQLDRGIFVGNEGLDADYTFSKDTSAVELWHILVMNADRDTAVRTITIYKGSGTAYSPINYFSNLKLGFQNNNTSGHFLDVNNGFIFDETSVAGHESEIDLLVYYYVTSGLPSPTFICPGYVSVVGYYPLIGGWPVKNNILYDYYSSDNNLITTGEFDAAQNDSLLVTAYKPDKVSGNCKYGYTGKVIPFKTQEGKYGLIKVIHADEINDGTMEIAIKIQK